MPEFTLRNAAKYLVKTLVAARTAELAADTLADHTRFDKDDKLVKISSHMVGWAVSSKLEQYTDRLVDKTADFLAERQAKQAENATIK